MSSQVDLAEYLFTRLHQLGVRSIHGVPGDYNLTALDYVEPCGHVWVGNCNELNAGYAADGYARVKGIAAVVTAFGVGELSAINAIAGAYAEMAPVVHIVGTPSTVAQEQRTCLHHSLGDGNFRLFADMYAKVTVAQANLIDIHTAASLIDRTLRECILQSRPVYIELPTNMVKAQVDTHLLVTPINTALPSNDEGFEDEEVDLILHKIYSSKQPFIVVDGFVSRYGISAEADELVRVTGFPTSTTPFGKGIVNETYPNFHGVYAGAAGRHEYIPWVESCDLVLRLGPLNSDVNTFGFTTVPKPEDTVTFHRDHVDICNTHTYQNLHVKPLLRKILDRLDHGRLPKYTPYPDLGSPARELALLPPTSPSGPIDQATFYRRISPFFHEHDTILAETGTPAIGARDFLLPPHAQLITSSLWLSIGYMLAATQGAALAKRDATAPGRTILFTGDGSLQMTAQAISDVIRHRLDVTIIILNNDGYVIERFIHGMQAGYNEVQPWRYLMAPEYFGADLHEDAEYPIWTKRVASWGELEAVLAENGQLRGKGLRMLEVMMGREDAPASLKELVGRTSRRNES